MKLSEIRGNIEPGVFYSGVGHAGLVLWVLVGDWLFAPRASQEIMATQVSLMSEAEFSAMMSTSPAVSETPSEAPPGAQSPETPVETPPSPEADRSPTPPARPDSAPPPAPDPVPDTAPPPAELPPAEVPPEPVTDPVPDPVPGDVQPDPVALAPLDQPLPSMSTSTRPRPKPANVVAPNPQTVPDDVQVSDTAEAAVSEQPTDTPQLPQEAREETVERETGDVLRTEATEEQDQALGMTSSTRPRARPAQRPTQTATTPTTPANTAPSTSSSANTSANAQNDAIANALSEASETPASNTTQGQGGGTRTPAPQGPPLTAGETGDVSAAIGRKWNLGAVSSDVMQTTVVVRVEFDPSGKPTDIRLIDSNGPSQEAARVAFDTARRAIQRTYLEGGIPLPPNKYETWKVVDFVFDANGMRFR